jgi:hypothetical protein
MGGIGSGRWYRWNTKTTLDDCRSMDINRMVKEGSIKEGCRQSGVWVWTDAETKEQTSSISYECNTLDYNNPYLRIHYTITSTGEKIDYKIKLSRSTPNYGGSRLWFLCPITNKRVSKLFLISGQNKFVSRHAYKVSYASQNQCKFSRAIDKKWKIVRKTDGYDYPVRKKGMHQKTYWNILVEFWKQERLCDSLMFKKFQLAT